MSDALLMGQDMATEVTDAEGLLSGSEPDATVRLLMMQAIARGILDELQGANSWNFGTIYQANGPDWDFGTISSPTGPNVDLGGIT